MKFSFQQAALVTSLHFIIIFSRVSAGTALLALTSGLNVNAKSRSAHNMNLQLESDSEDSFLPYHPDKEEQLRQRGASPFPDYYPAPHAKDSKWRFDLHFAVEAEIVRPLLPCRESGQSFGFRRNRSLRQISQTPLPTIRTNVALRHHE